MNNVPLRITQDLKAAMDALMAHRSAVGIPDTNKFFFASYSQNGHLDCCQVIQKIGKMGGVKHPERITTTRLRKYVATMMQLYDLNHNELDWLSNHLGHSMNIHKHHYRQHTATIEMGEVARLLMQVEDGQTADHSGRSVDDITLDGE